MFEIGGSVESAAVDSRQRIQALIDAVTSLGVGTTDRERVDHLELLERGKAAFAAAQVRNTYQFEVSQTARGRRLGHDPGLTWRSIGGQVGLARRESRHHGRRLVGVAHALMTDMPCTMAALERGDVSERRAGIVVAQFAFLTGEDRRKADAVIAPDLPRLGDQGAQRLAATIGYRLDPEGALAKVRGAVKDRHVSVRPAPEAMSRVSALLPAAHGVAVHTALKREADRRRACGDRRSHSQIMADTMVGKIVGPHLSGCSSYGAPDYTTWADADLNNKPTTPTTSEPDHANLDTHLDVDVDLHTDTDLDTARGATDVGAATDTQAVASASEAADAADVAGAAGAADTPAHVEADSAAEADADADSDPDSRADLPAASDPDPAPETVAAETAAETTDADSEHVACTEQDITLAPENAADHDAGTDSDTEAAGSTDSAARGGTCPDLVADPDFIEVSLVGDPPGLPPEIGATPDHRDHQLSDDPDASDGREGPDHPGDPGDPGDPGGPATDMDPDTDTDTDAAVGGSGCRCGGLEVNLIMTDRTLFGDDQEPAYLTGHGPIPAALARALVIGNADTATKAWVRRLYTDPTGSQLVAMESRSRLFPKNAQRFLIARDQVCRTPWCDAPIAQHDHVIPSAKGGPTDIRNGQGLCRACNQTKEAPGWVSRTEPDGSISLITPTGRAYHGRAPRPPHSEPWPKAVTVEDKLAGILFEVIWPTRQPATRGSPARRPPTPTHRERN